jgi:hypothetical protein
MCDETYWERVSYEGTVPWTLKAIEGKGFVAFSNRNFSAGEWICTEFPTVWIHGHHPFNNQQIADIQEKINKLDSNDKMAFMSMANSFSNEFHPYVGIFMTNCFDMTDSKFGESCAMYLALARLNHSCTPNVQQTHYADTTEEVLYASRDIKVGDEINDCYIDLRQKKSERKAQLLQYYRFDCECQGCLQEDSKDDALRIKVGKSSDIIISLVENDYHNEALKLSIEIVDLLENKKHLNWSIRYIAEACLNVYQLSFALNKIEQALLYLNKAHYYNVFLQGEKSFDSLKTKNMISNF